MQIEFILIVVFQTTKFVLSDLKEFKNETFILHFLIPFLELYYFLLQKKLSQTIP